MRVMASTRKAKKQGPASCLRSEVLCTGHGGGRSTLLWVGNPDLGWLDVLPVFAGMLLVFPISSLLGLLSWYMVGGTALLSAGIVLKLAASTVRFAQFVLVWGRTSAGASSFGRNRQA